MSCKKTILYEDHVKRGARMVSFAGVMLPIRFSREQEEHMAVRRHVGIFDVSHMGQIFVRKKNAVKFLQNVLTNDVESLTVGRAQYSLMLNDKAFIIDDIIVYRLEKEIFLLCVNASNIEKDFHHLQKYAANFADVEIENASSRYAQFALQGPNARDLLKTFTSEPLPTSFFIKKISILNIEILLACTGYTGEDGFEIFVVNDQAKIVWDALLLRGAEFYIKPCGLAARDSLRLEAGMRLYGNDMNETTTPQEAGLMFAVAINKEADFIGKNALMHHQAEKKLLGFKLLDKGIARQGNKVMNKEQNIIGVVTSSGYIPEKNLAIGFAMLDKTTHINDEVRIDIRGRLVNARICPTKFL